MKAVSHIVDYKNTRYLKDFLNPHGRINSKRRNQVPTRDQRKIQNAVKRARFMALLPYIIK